MDSEQFTLTTEQQGLLASLALETGKPIPVLLSEALEELQDHVHGRHIHVEAVVREQHTGSGATNGGPAQSASRPIWEIFEEASQAIREEELARLPTDLAAQVDHYVYGLPKR